MSDPKKQYQLQASWKNLGKSWTCAIYSLCYLFLLHHHCKPIERSMVFFPKNLWFPTKKNSVLVLIFSVMKQPGNWCPGSLSIWFGVISGKIGWGCNLRMSQLGEFTIWVFSKIGVGTQKLKWMVKIMENPIRMDDLGVALFLETSIYIIYTYT